ILAILNSGSFGLMQLWELTDPDDPKLINRKKTSYRDSLHITEDYLGSKTDRFFTANDILLKRNHSDSNPIVNVPCHFLWRDRLFPNVEWSRITSIGVPPSRIRFLCRFHQFFSRVYGGHSLRADGAMLLTRMGVDFNLIQALGRWSSDTLYTHIHQHPLIVHKARHP
ncbi:hypothetical protein P691DRAFT_664294, partial [Macrolepiota fuliginosa MF-IS2]